MEREKRNEILVAAEPELLKMKDATWDERREVERAHRCARAAALRELAAAVAVELGKLGYATSVAPEPEDDSGPAGPWIASADLPLEDFAGDLALRFTANPHEPKRLAIRVGLSLALHPHGAGVDRPSITVAITRPEVAIAREIERRILPGARELLRVARERRAAHEKRSAGANAAADLLLATGFFLRAPGSRADSSVTLYFNDGPGVSVDGLVDVTSERVRLDRLNIDADDLVAVLALLAERRKAAA